MGARRREDKSWGSPHPTGKSNKILQVEALLLLMGASFFPYGGLFDKKILGAPMVRGHVPQQAVQGSVGHPHNNTVINMELHNVIAFPDIDFIHDQHVQGNAQDAQENIL